MTDDKADEEEDDDPPWTREDEIAELQDDLEILRNARATTLAGPSTADRASKALDRFAGGKKVLIVYLVLLALAGATFIWISNSLLAMLFVSVGVGAALYGVAYVWETVSRRIYWRANRDRMIAELDDEIEDVKKELFKLGVKGLDHPMRR